jgi:glycosyltransferase involved in cell wall biosynthesis
MPVYNGEIYLKRAIDSLLSQSFSDWELIVVDDGSTDGTPQILQQYTDTRIRIFHQKNGGEANARNTGLANITGEYMAFLDADDEYLPGALESMVSYLDRHSQYAVMFSDGYICNHEDQQLMRLTDIRPGIFTGNILNQLVLTPTVITVPVCTMTRISSVRAHALNFDEKNNLYGTDWDFWIRLAVHEQFGYLDELTCKYRIHETNITRVYGSEKRRNDSIYCRMKVLDSEWFDALSLTTKQVFFLNLLTDVMSGEIEKQKSILQNEKFLAIPASVKSFLWRSIGIDALQTNHDVDFARHCFQESLSIRSSDRKTRLLLSGLTFGRPFVLIFVKLWRLFLQVKNRFSVSDRAQTQRLQKFLGIQ